jgi:hypothetical protein
LERRFRSAGEALAALQSGFTAQNSSQLTNSPHTGKILPPTGSQALEALDTEGFSACVAKTIPQPSNSRVRLTKSPKQLSIKMPLRWSTLKSMADNGFWISCLRYQAIGILFLLLIFLLFGLFIGPIREWKFFLVFELVKLGAVVLIPMAICFGIALVEDLLNMLIPTKIFRAVFHRDVFTLESYWWGFCYSKLLGRTAEIQKVVKSVTEISPSIEKPIVEIHTIKYKYFFGKGLTEVECAWLAQEIQTWLNLK